jgi:hypothetical protein
MNVSYRSELVKLTKKELIDYCEMMANNWWNLQNNWMLNITQRYGSETAAEFDALVFGRQAEVQAWRLKKLFNLGDDIQSMIKAVNLSTLLSNVEFEYVEVGEKHCRIRVISCSMQLARRDLGLPELPCKIAGMAANSRFALAINPKIKTTCIVCPPDKHPENLWCEWQFDLVE